MKNSRRLTLKREALTALSTPDLENVVGANAITVKPCTSLNDSCRVCSLNCPYTINTCGE